MTAKGWIAACMLAVLTGMIGHGLIAFAQRELPVATIGIIQVAQPAIAVCWSFLILGEQVKLAQVPGMVLVIIGLVAFTVIGQRRSATATATVDGDQHGELAGPAG
jgi:drug/metabolite transporter (DMT)-like permease